MRRHTSDDPRRRPSQERSRATVDAVVEAAAQLLVEEGPDTTTNRIAERAGVSVGSIYQYFPDKKAIYDAVVERHIQRLEAMAERLDGVLASAPADVAIRAAVAGVVAVEAADPALGAALNRLPPALHVIERIHAFEASIGQRVGRWLAASGELGRDVDPALAGRLLVRALGGLVRTSLAVEPGLVADPRFTREMEALVRGYLSAQSA